MQHQSVLLNEIIKNLDIKSGDIFVDGTLGGGGHMEAICQKFGNNITAIGIDLDSDAIDRSKERLQKYDVKYLYGSFKNIAPLLNSIGIGDVDKILLDLGLSSNQLEESGRGFSFQKDEPLLMTFYKKPTLEDMTAYDIVNSWEEQNIADVLYGYGEEKFARRIARAIVRSRSVKKIETTFELVDIIMSATPKFYHYGKIHPATRTFQALRIAVNDEMRTLFSGLRESFARLKSKGRLGVISFHSLEDRQVKQFFKILSDEKKAVLINKKPIEPSDDEVRQNPRSRSAKLRVIEKI